MSNLPRACAKKDDRFRIPFCLPSTFLYIVVEQSCHHGFEKEKKVGRVKCSKEPSEKEIKLSRAMVSSSMAESRSERRSKYRSGRVRTEELQRRVNL